MYIHIYICICISLYLCIYIYMYIDVYTQMYVHVYIYIYIYTHVDMYLLDIHSCSFPSPKEVKVLDESVFDRQGTKGTWCGDRL